MQASFARTFEHVGNYENPAFTVNGRPTLFLGIERLLLQNRSDGLKVIAVKPWSDLTPSC